MSRVKEPPRPEGPEEDIFTENSLLLHTDDTKKHEEGREVTQQEDLPSPDNWVIHQDAEHPSALVNDTTGDLIRRKALPGSMTGLKNYLFLCHALLPFPVPTAICDMFGNLHFSPPLEDGCVHCILTCLFCEFVTFCNIILGQASCGICTSENCCCCCGADDLGDDCNCPCDMDCGIMDACCESSDCLEICMECCGICFPS
ncbi:myoD family inhibitor domain-containing protein [Rhincodon typus]|uniref:myoD family inhibitor domain-containing protein n=1 Tax=Rhincodon typus TaxID=259920 RepID=UPI00202FFB65|nr:myoD family inhibitor domain-containing protein [Rhincodon typus]